MGKQNFRYHIERPYSIKKNTFLRSSHDLLTERERPFLPDAYDKWVNGYRLLEAFARISHRNSMATHPVGARPNAPYFRRGPGRSGLGDARAWDWCEAM